MITIEDEKKIICSLMGVPFTEERFYVAELKMAKENLYTVVSVHDISSLCCDSPVNRIYVSTKTIVSVLDVSRGDRAICFLHNHPLNRDGKEVFFSYQDYKTMETIYNISEKLNYNNMICFGVYDSISVVFEVKVGDYYEKCRFVEGGVKSGRH